ncbi:hypothetical protein [Croceivirga radicis]|uniref:SIMPL domain-containing protein n=1 Tax=Croceivirga radicis TaxID=1929488 RepID=A0A1V6LQY1_9FLAO|nr:hypothetical protein [Croceivirga radicis]OQD42366.1 hypothetical protein BUL40_11410 [Croceivirga radicis]
MKAIVTFIFIILIGNVAMAQSDKKVEVKPQGVQLNIKVNKTEVKATEVARLYMFKNSRIKKELSFKTKKSNAKLA